MLLTETVRAGALDEQLSTALARWRDPNAVHDPAKIVLDLAVTLALGGDCLVVCCTGQHDLHGVR